MKKYLSFAGFILIATVLYSGQNIDAEYGYVDGRSVNVRSGPSTISKKLGKFKFGELVEILGRSDRKFKYKNNNFYWYIVKTQEKKTGWIYGKFLTLLKYKPKTESYYVNYIKKILRKKFNKCQKHLLKFKQIKGKNYITARYIYACDKYSADGALEIYKYDGDDIDIVVSGTSADNYFFIDHYILIYHPGYSMECYDVKDIIPEKVKEREENKLSSMISSYTESIYKRTYRYHNITYSKEFSKSSGKKIFRGDVSCEYFHNDRILKVYIRLKEKGPVKWVKRLKFKNGLFVSLE